MVCYIADRSHAQKARRAMKRVLYILPAMLLAVACGSDGESCEIGVENWSTANSGGLCQVNFFGTTEYAVYCSGNSDTGYDCACGAAVDNPETFQSINFCELEPKERACTAIAMCNFPL